MVPNGSPVGKRQRVGSPRLLQGCFQECMLGGGQTGLGWGSAEVLSYIVVNGQRVALLGLKHVK